MIRVGSQVLYYCRVEIDESLHIGNLITAQCGVTDVSEHNYVTKFVYSSTL